MVSNSLKQLFTEKNEEFEFSAHIAVKMLEEGVSENVLKYKV